MRREDLGRSHRRGTLCGTGGHRRRPRVIGNWSRAVCPKKWVVQLYVHDQLRRRHVRRRFLHRRRRRPRRRRRVGYCRWTTARTSARSWATHWASWTALSTTAPTALLIDVSTAGCWASRSLRRQKTRRRSAEPSSAATRCGRTACAVLCAIHGLSIDERQPRRSLVDRLSLVSFVARRRSHRIPASVAVLR